MQSVGITVSKTLLLVGIASLMCIAETRAGGVTCLQADSVEKALSTDANQATRAIQTLRALGQPGLDAIFDRYHQEIAQLRRNPRTSNPELTRLREAIDSIAQQKDAYASQLYWYTDLEKAKASAKSTGKPILSLRLLGSLSDELSCANSRFFRTTLYSNDEISRCLREKFVLHWESVRPVPKMTVDFGDGRTLVRTITGNSIHYILSPGDEILEALPGLYSPGAFLTGVSRAADLAQKLAHRPVEERLVIFQDFHREQLRHNLMDWIADLKTLDPAKTFDVPKDLTPAKLAVKADLVAETERLGWPALGALRFGEVHFDRTSKALIASKIPTAEQAAKVAVSKSRVEVPALNVFQPLQQSISADTYQNEYKLHSTIHEWLAAAQQLPLTVREFNNRVYADLFLMPANDPWLGLSSPEQFSAVPDDGRNVAGTR